MEVEVLGSPGVIAAFVLEFGKVVENVEIFWLECVILLQSFEKLTPISRILDLFRHVFILQNLQRKYIALLECMRK